MQNQPKEVRINLAAGLKYLDQMQIIPQEEEFIFLIASGNEGQRYVASPKHAKRISLLLQKLIKEYEKKNGEIQTQLTRPPKHKDPEIGFSTSRLHSKTNKETEAA